MGLERRVTTCAVVLACGLGAVASAADRLAILEFFGRPQGTYCSAAGPAMKALQREMAGEAVLLEYDYDSFWSGRQDRFWATGVSANYLPLVMVGSGYRTSSGYVEYEAEYRAMIEDELARPPRAEIDAWWRRSGSRVTVYATVRNTRAADLRVAEEAAVWLIVYQSSPIGVSDTWVRAQKQWLLESDLARGESVDATIDLVASSVTDWDRADLVALVEDHPGGSGRYDMLQAADVRPAAVEASPGRLDLSPGPTSAEIELDGPHVLDWTATTDVPWLELTPTTGTLPATVTVTVLPELRHPMDVEGVVLVEASGDGMELTVEVGVTAGSLIRRPAGRLAPEAQQALW